MNTNTDTNPGAKPMTNRKLHVYAQNMTDQSVTYAGDKIRPGDSSCVLTTFNADVADDECWEIEKGGLLKAAIY